MDGKTKQWHLDIGQAAGRDSTCGTKVNYKSEESSEKAALRLNQRGDRRNELEHYPCYWCNGWHIGRKMT